MTSFSSCVRKVRRGLPAMVPFILLFLLSSSCSGQPARIDNGISGEAEGIGTLIPSGGVSYISSTAAGTLASLKVGVGWQVTSGEPVAEIYSGNGTITVSSFSSGVIVKQDSRVGDTLSVGQAIFRLAMPNVTFNAATFVAATLGKALSIGTPATVTVAGVPTNIYGSIVGKVSSISVLPATPPQIEQVIGHDEQMKSRIYALGPALEVVISLSRSSQNASGFQWTKGNGPPFPLKFGVKLSARFN